MPTVLRPPPIHPAHPPASSFSVGSPNASKPQSGSTAPLSAHLELTHSARRGAGSCPRCLSSPLPRRARVARGSPGRVIRKRMQIRQLENPAQETPGPTSPGPQPPLTQPPRALSPSQPLLVAQHSQPGTASGESSHAGQLRNAENENSHGEGKKK